MTDKYKELREAAERATPGEWSWWTSCSWRRLKSSQDGNDKDVIEPIVARDGHPDCNISEADMAYIEKAQPAAILELLRVSDALLGALLSVQDEPTYDDACEHIGQGLDALAASVGRTSDDFDQDSATADVIKMALEYIAEGLKPLGIKWDADNDCYVVSSLQNAERNGNYDKIYLDIVATLDEVAQPWMRDDGDGGMCAVVRRMASDAARSNQEDPVAEVGPARTIRWLPPFVRPPVGTKPYTEPQSQAVMDEKIIKLGSAGKAFDAPTDRRAYTFAEQPNNTGAYRLGQAMSEAAKLPSGDWIDSGLCLLKTLQTHGFGVFEIGDYLESSTPAQPKVPECITAFIAQKKLELNQYVSEYCYTEPDTGAGVWDSEYHQQHAEDLEQFIYELEGMLSAFAPKGGV